MSAGKKGDSYVLPRGGSELKRLNTQHEVTLRHVCDGRYIFDEAVKLRESDCVLDTGAGTCAWALGLTAIVPASVQLYATDLSAQNFPPSDSTPANLYLRIASSTSLPLEWSEKFDFVNQRFLIGGLRAEEWQVASSEIFRVLKPGRAVQLIEARPPAPKGPAMEKFTSLALALFEKTGHSYDVLFHLDQLLANAGFTDIHVHAKGIPVGKKWGDVGVQDAETMRAGLVNLAPAFQKAGLIQSDADYFALLDEAEKEWDEHGSEFDCRLVTARKPVTVTV